MKTIKPKESFTWILFYKTFLLQSYLDVYYIVTTWHIEIYIVSSWCIEIYNSFHSYLEIYFQNLATS